MSGGLDMFLQQVVHVAVTFLMPEQSKPLFADFLSRIFENCCSQVPFFSGCAVSPAVLLVLFRNCCNGSLI